MLNGKCFLKLTIILTILAMFSLATAQEKDKKSEDEITMLKSRVAELEKTVAGLKKQATMAQDSVSGPVGMPAPQADSELEKELARELGMETPQASSSPAIPQSQTSSTAASGGRNLFQNMNPNISVIGTLIGDATSLNSVDRNVDLAFEEGEFSFQAVVDPYAKANLFISFGQELGTLPTPGPQEERGGGLSPEIEEGYVTLLTLPLAMQLKAGKFRSKFGRINETHPHAYNFINLPLVFANFFGAEGLNDEGASLSWLVPNGKFFQELTFQITRGPLENASFARAEDNHLLYLAHLKNLFELNDNTTMELGLTGLTGPNNPDGKTTQIFGADLTFKWKPLRFNRYKSFELLNEFLISKRNGISQDVTSVGLYSFLRYQVAKRWFIGAMYDYSEFPKFDNFHHQAFSGIVQYFTTEFQKFETQVRFNQGNFFDDYVDFRVRAIFVIGAHGAHQY